MFFRNVPDAENQRNPLQHTLKWFYYSSAQYFGTGNFAGDVAVLTTVNVGLIIAGLFVFRKRDIRV